MQSYPRHTGLVSDNLVHIKYDFHQTLSTFLSSSNSEHTFKHTPKPEFSLTQLNVNFESLLFLVSETDCLNQIVPKALKK